eukprot:scaffold14974_cov195-Amphora_coffeaeformis.AAC.15
MIPDHRESAIEHGSWYGTILYQYFAKVAHIIPNGPNLLFGKDCCWETLVQQRCFSRCSKIEMTVDCEES